MNIQRFVEELQRRRVFRVAGAYLVASWFAIEVSTTVLEILAPHNEQRYATYVLYAAICGMPIMLVLAWMFDVTKQGIVRTPPRSEVFPGEGVTDGASAAMTTLQGKAIPRAVKPRVVLSARATGMFGLGAVVAIASLAAYTQVHQPSSADALMAADSVTLVNIKSIAVMPFEDMSEERDQQYFADGMTEELLNRLAQLENLQIVSGEGYAGPRRGGDLRSVAEGLNVQAVLQGSVRRSEDSLRITVKMMNPANNALLYSASFTRATSNVFQVQDEIAASVANSLQLQLNTGLAQASGNRGTTNETAYELYLQGQAGLEKRTDAELRRAIKFFERARDLDPKFALAYAGLAQVYAVLPTVGDFSFEEAGTKGNEAAAFAISLDPSLGQAHAAIGQIAQNIGWNPAMAENSYKRAIQFMPNYATAHQWYAETLMMLGRTDEGLREIRKALELEPYSPAAKNTLGYLLTVRGDLDSALVVFRNEAAAYPDYRLGHLTHALTALTPKKYAEAETSALAYAGADTQLAAAMTTVIRGAAGSAPLPAAKKAAAALEPKLGSGFTALWFAAIGDTATALRLVTKTAEAANDANFPYFVIHPLLKPLHASPVYQEVVRTMGVTPAR